MRTQADRTGSHDPAGDDPGDDPRVLALVKEYQADLDHARRPDRAGYLARHPDLAAALSQYFDGLDLLRQGAKDLTGSAARPGRLDTGLARGDRLGEYEIVREVGRGGMGVVYEAWQPALNRRVAVKVLPAGVAADRNRLRRFAVEAQAAAAVDHPHIVPVYAIGEDRGVNYYVMRLVNGVSLDVLVAGLTTRTAVLSLDETWAATPAPSGAPPRPAPVVGLPAAPGPTDALARLAAADRRAYHRAVARLGADVARALDHAHQSGVVHRDVKPANLLLDIAGHVWVTDFGLAQFTVGPTVTRTGATIGTLRYMSPEQAAGDRRRLDHRTDVYSLAATLYELLTGRAPFPSEEPAVLLNQIIHDDPPPVRTTDPAVPPDLETVVLKAMQKDPRDRYTTAGELADDLDRFLTGRPVLARRPSGWDRAKRWAGRHPAAVVAVLVSLLVAGTASAITTALVTAEQHETEKAYKAEQARADEAERRFHQSKELSDLVLRISEEEIGSDSPFQGPRRRLLLAALENYRTLLADGHDPAVRAELDALLARVERLLADQAALREAETAFQLGDPSVRDGLGLSPAQIERIQQILHVRGPDFHGPDMRRLMSDPATRTELLTALTGPQRQRLRQIFFQARGAMVFNEPEVVEELRLTPAQRRQIKEIQAEWFALLGPPGGFGRRPGGDGGPGGGRGKPPNAPPGGPGGGRSKSGGPPGGRGGDPGGGPWNDGPGGPRPGEPRFNPEVAAKVMERILELLTPEQRVAWQTLTGKPFTAARWSAPGP